MNEKLSISNITPFRARHYDYQHFTYPWHFHSEFEIIYIKKSTGTAFIGNSIEKYNHGDLFLIGSNLPHYLKSDEIFHQTDSQLRVTGTIIQFEKDFMQYSVNYYPQFFRIKNLLEESQFGLVFPAECSTELIQSIENLPNEKGMIQLISFLKILNLMSEIKARKTLSKYNFEYDKHNTASRADKVLSFINNNYTRSIQLEEIASFASMNASAFCRFFKKETGKTLKTYIHEMRVGYACKLLIMNQLNISQISSECGFDTISHFNKAFKKTNGYSPSEYRKIMLNINK